MRSFVFSCFAVLLLCGCGDEGKLKQLVRERLNDPESAMFKESVFSKAQHRACLAWNAKNGMGGYGEWQVAEFKKSEGGEWQVLKMKVHPFTCSDYEFQTSDAVDKAEMQAKDQVANLLISRRKISAHDAARLSNDIVNCKIAWKYVYSSMEIARNRSDGIEYHQKKKNEAQAELEKGNC